MIRLKIYYITFLFPLFFYGCSSSKMTEEKKDAVVPKKWDFTMYRDGQLVVPKDSAASYEIWYGFTDSLTNKKTK